jgi:lipopolysaccharide heptosyltransferase II
MDRAALEQRLSHLAPRRIAIIKPSALGDIVQTLPLLPALRKRFPASWIAWIVQRELSDLVAGHPDLDRVLTINRRPTWMEAARFLQTLREQQFELVLDLQGLMRTAAMTWATGARWRIGLETAREGAGLSINLTIPDTHRSVPAHERYWRVAEVLGVGNVPRRAIVQVSTADYCRAKELLRCLPRPIFAVQWGARWETKRWPLEQFCRVLNRAGQEWGGSAVFVGGPGERAACAAAVERLAADSQITARNLAGDTTLKQLAALLTMADAVLANDSGPLHLAAELGTPVLGIFTCTSPQRSGPPGDRHDFVSTQLSCAASYHKRCPHAGERHLQCHRELTADRVWSALVRFMERLPIARKSHDLSSVQTVLQDVDFNRPRHKETDAALLVHPAA